MLLVLFGLLVAGFFWGIYRLIRLEISQEAKAVKSEKLAATAAVASDAQAAPKLLSCGVCDGKVASNAANCPHCGAPVSNELSPPQPISNAATPSPEGGFSLGKLFWGGAVIALIWFGLTAASRNTSSSDEAANRGSSAIRQRIQPRCDAQRAMVVRNIANAKCDQFSIESCSGNVMRTGVPYEECMDRGRGCFRNTVRELGCGNSRFFR